MKRYAVIIIVFLQIGAIVNVAVAWGLAATPRQHFWIPSEWISAPSAWPGYLQQCDWPAPKSAAQRNDVRGGATFLQISAGSFPIPQLELTQRDPIHVSLSMIQFGFPMRSMQWNSHNVMCRQDLKELLKCANDAAGYRRGIDISRMYRGGTFSHHRLPLTLLWPGFAINTLFYAITAWLLVVVPVRFRTYRRRRRGLCERCAYPIGTSPVCSECGAAVVSREHAK